MNLIRDDNKHIQKLISLLRNYFLKTLDNTEVIVVSLYWEMTDGLGSIGYVKILAVL